MMWSSAVLRRLLVEEYPHRVQDELTLIGVEPVGRLRRNEWLGLSCRYAGCLMGCFHGTPSAREKALSTDSLGTLGSPRKYSEMDVLKTRTPLASAIACM
jgi:hypothetical protein